MDFPLVDEFLKFKGKKLEYRKETGVARTRELVKILQHAGTNEYFAVFKYNNSILRMLRDTKKVPLSQVTLPSIKLHEIEMKTNRKLSRNVAGFGSQSENTIVYNTKIYEVTKQGVFKRDEDVVWKHFSDINDPCIGKVVVTAEREGIHRLESMAIVNLNKVVHPGSSGCPPRYIPYYSGVKTTVFVPVEELLTLKDWINEEMNKSKQEDEWKVVTKKRNKGKGKPLGIEQIKPQSHPQPSTSKVIVNQPTSQNSDVLGGKIMSKVKTSKNKDSEFKTRPKSSQKSKLATTTITISQENQRKSVDTIIPHINNVSVPNAEINWQLPINTNKFKKAVKNTEGYWMGVQGNNNSCYMDSSLFALFSFSHVLDKFLLMESTDESGNRAKRILRTEIVYHMRQDRFFVPHTNMRRLRKIFRKEFTEEYKSNFMDVEDFLGDMFKLIGIPHFLQYDNEETDYIHQIALPFTWEKSQYTSYLSLQSLLEDSFKTFEVKLEKVPEDIFIIKLPVSDGVLIPCTGVVPNLALDLRNILASQNNIEKRSVMKLKVVICLHQNHFVAFVKTSDALDSSWVYMDSNPTTNIPYISLLRNIDQNLKNAMEAVESDKDLVSSFEPKCENYSLFRRAYICIYTH